MREGILFVVLGFALTLPWGKPLWAWLARMDVRKHIRSEGPDAHQTKEGTLTMGGLLILIGVSLVALGLALAGFWRPLGIWGAMAAFGALGAYDDWQGLFDRDGVGWLARSKFPAQWGIALLVALALYFALDASAVLVTPNEQLFRIGLGAVPLGMVLLVASANAVNLSDGLDGLATGLAIIAYGAYGILTLRSEQIGLAWFCFGAVGVLLAFLWFNAYPARVFMGDVGSQALGAGLAAVALLSGQWMLLPLVGGVFVVEAFSVILQVSYFKYTRRRYGEGRRIFRMAPLHHHLELGGLSETQVTLRLWILGALLAALGLLLGIF